MDSIEGQAGVGVSAYSLVDALRVALGKTANREEASRSFNKLKTDRPVLRNLQTVTISRRGERETPALTTLEQVHAVIDSKSYNSIAAAFKAQHLPAILSMLPASGVTTATRKPLPSYFALLDCVTHGARDAQYTGVARDHPSFKRFMIEMQAAEGTHFNVIHREEQMTGYLLLKFSCLFGGKPKWEESLKARGALQATDFKRTASAGHSIKVECPATITAPISLRYATVLGLVPDSAGKGGPMGVDDMRIPVSMVLGHCGH